MKKSSSTDLQTRTNHFVAEGIDQRQGVDGVTLLSIYIFMLLLIPANLIFTPLGSAGGPATLFGVAFIGFYLVFWMHPAFVVHRTRQPIRFAAALFFCAIVAAYVSVNRNSLSTITEDGADVGLILTFSWVGVLLLAADGINSMDRLKILLRRIVIGVTAMAAIGITEFVSSVNVVKYIFIPGLSSQSQVTDLLSRAGLNRPSATAAHPLEFAAVLAMALPLAIHQARFAPRGLRLRRWLQVACIGAALPLTVSRAAIFGLIIIFAVILPTWPKGERRYAYVIIIFSVTAMALSIHGLLGTFRDLFLQIGSSGSTTSRTGAFSLAGPFIAHHPWFGVGFNTFFPQTYFFVDDMYLGMVISTGFIGLLSLLVLFGTGWFEARSARHKMVDAESRDLAQCLAASIAACAVSFATFDALAFSMAAGLSFLLLGCVGAVWRLAATEDSAHASRQLR